MACPIFGNGWRNKFQQDNSRRHPACWRSWLLGWHQSLPPGVHPYPTLKGKKRFETLQAFNTLLAAYILIHQLLVPLTVYILQSNGSDPIHPMGFWHAYHLAIVLMMSQRFRTPRAAFAIVYLAWFAIGYLPLTLAATFWDEGALRLSWKTISGIFTYGASLVFTLFLLYRMRMPTTAFLFSLQERIIPNWRYAVPYALFGFVLSLFWLTCPIAQKWIDPTPPPPAPKPIIIRESPYE